MKLVKRLFVGNKETPLESENIVLDLDSPGRAAFVVKSQTPLKGLVAFEMGYQNKPVRYFLGFIERDQFQSQGYRRLFCRELAAALSYNTPLSQRHATVKTVLDEVAAQKGLDFVFPNQAYVETKIPHFFNTGTGYQLLDNLGRAAQIPDFVWQQQGNGQIFVGAFKDSFWFGKPIPIPDEFTEGAAAGKQFNMPAAPNVRPGALFSNKQITRVQFSDSNMAVTWKRKH